MHTCANNGNSLFISLQLKNPMKKQSEREKKIESEKVAKHQGMKLKCK